MPRLKTLSLTTLLLHWDKLPLRVDDRLEHLLERFHVRFDAGRVSKATIQLQRGNLVFWCIDGVFNSLELTTSASHEPSDLIDWCGFNIGSDDLLAWCTQQQIPLRLVQEQSDAQVYQTPSGALLALHNQQLWNITWTV